MAVRVCFCLWKCDFPFSGSPHKTETCSLLQSYRKVPTEREDGVWSRIRSPSSSRQIRTQTSEAIFKLFFSKYDGKLSLWKFLLRPPYTVDPLHDLCNNAVFRLSILLDNQYQFANYYYYYYYRFLLRRFLFEKMCYAKRRVLLAIIRLPALLSCVEVSDIQTD